MKPSQKTSCASFLLILFLLPFLQGCFALVATGVAVGVSTAVDRRSVGTQADDEAIEWKALKRSSEQLSDKVHLNFTSYNRRLLISGEVSTPEELAQVSKMALEIPEVTSVFNQARVAAATSLGARSSDAYITTKVKARSIDLKGKFNPIHVKVVTENSVVYLMGIVTKTEGDSAIQIARTTTDVKRVVNLLEVLSTEDIKALEFVRTQEEQKTPAASQGSNAR